MRNPPAGTSPLDAAGALLCIVITVAAASIAVYWAVTTVWAMPAAIPITAGAITAALLYRCRLQRLALLAELRLRDQATSLPELDPLPYSEYGQGATRLIGHNDRDIVITRLGDRYASGHLTADEFETRADQAAQARTSADLARTLRDLP